MTNNSDDQGRTPTVEEIAKTYRLYVGAMARLEKIKQEAAGERGTISGYRNDFKKIGGDWSIIKATFALEGQDDPAAFLRDLNKTAVAVGVILLDQDPDGQVSFLRTFEQPKGPEFIKLMMGRVNGDGYNSGMAGGPLENNPHKAGTEEHSVWASAWKKGVTDREADGKAARIPSTEVRKRGAKADRAAGTKPEGTKKRGRPPGVKNGEGGSNVTPIRVAAAE